MGDQSGVNCSANELGPAARGPPKWLSGYSLIFGSLISGASPPVSQLDLRLSMIERCDYGVHGRAPEKRESGRDCPRRGPHAAPQLSMGEAGPQGRERASREAIDSEDGVTQ